MSSSSPGGVRAWPPLENVERVIGPLATIHPSNASRKQRSLSPPCSLFWIQTSVLDKEALEDF